MNNCYLLMMRPRMCAMMSLMLLVFAGRGIAQDTPSAQEPQADQEPVEVAEPEEEELPVVAKDATPPTPLPGPEIMRPTEHGFRVTHRMMEFFTNRTAKASARELKLSDEQATKFEALIGKHLNAAYRRSGNDMSTAIERLVELAISTEGNLSAENAGELNEALKPVLSAIPEYIDDFMNDAKPILNQKQYEDLLKDMNKTKDKIKITSNRLDKWSKGEDLKKDDNLFQMLFEDDEKFKAEREEGRKTATKPAKTPARERAEGRFQRSMSEIGPDSWPMFLYVCRDIYGFNGDQFDKGNKILGEYRKRANELMTPEWKQRAKLNRMKTHAKKILDDESIEPWLYHLDREFEEMVKPIKELGREYRHEIVGLATQEQRSQVLAHLRKFGTDHGMSEQDMSVLALHWATSQPEGK